jgi:hypothetical protein
METVRAMIGSIATISKMTADSLINYTKYYLIKTEDLRLNVSILQVNWLAG